MYRKGSYIAGRIAGLAAVMLFGCMVAVQTPYVQTRLTLKVLDRLTETLDSHISYDELRVMPSGVLLLRNAVILDEHPYTEDAFGRGWDRVDTLFRAKTVTATFSLSSIFRGEGLHLDRVNIDDAMLHLTSEPGEYPGNLERVFRLEPQTERPEPGPEIFSIRKVRISNFRFRLNNFNEAESVYPGYGINYDDLDLTADVNAHGLRFAGGRMYGTADRISATEKSGYRIIRASGRCEAGQGKTLVENFRLQDPWSQVRVRTLSMSYAEPDAFNNFVEEVLMEVDLRDTELGIPTLKYLANTFDGVESTLSIRSCDFKGYVNDFSFSDLRFEDRKNGVAGTLSGGAVGLPDTGRMLADIDVEELNFDSRGLSGMLADWMEDAPDLSSYAPGVRFKLSAAASGPLDRLRVEAALRSAAGSVHLNADVRNLVSSARGIEINADLGTSALRIDGIMPGLPFGECSLEARASARLGGGMSRVRLDTLAVSSIDFQGSVYSGISASGSFINNTLNCRLESSDPSLQLSLDAGAGPGDDGSTRLRAAGTIAGIDLRKLKIDPRDGVSRIGLNINADVSLKGDEVNGYARLNGIQVENGAGRSDIGDIALKAYTHDGRQHFNFNSPFADLSFCGTASVGEFIGDLQDISLHRHLPSLYAAADTSDLKSADYEIEATFHDTRKLLSFVMPGLYIADSTRFSLAVENDVMLGVSLSSSRLAFGRNYLRNAQLSLDNNFAGLWLDVSGSELRLGNILVSRPELEASAMGDRFGLSLDFDRFAGGGTDGKLLLDGSIARDSSGVFTLNAHPLDSYLATSDGVWNFAESDIVYNGEEIRVDGFRLSKGGQMISLDGGYSKVKPDTLQLSARDIDLSIIDEFLSDSPGIRGTAGGRVLLTSGTELLPGALINFRLDSLGIDGTDAGNIRIASSIGEQSDKVRILMRHSILGRDALVADGNYGLSDGTLDLTARLDQLPLSVAGPFLTGVLDQIDGGVSGDIVLRRDSTGFSISGDALNIDDALLGVAFTGVDYRVNGPLSLDNRGLYFDDVVVSDGSDGFGRLSGAIRHDHLKDFRLDAHADFDNLLAVNASEGGSSGIYGRLRVSGGADISGPFASLAVNADLRTTGIGNIHIPASESVSSSTSNLLTFTQPVKPVDPYDEMLSDYDTATGGGGDIDIQARLTAHSGVTAYIELDKSAGNIASFSGEGSVAVHLRPSGGIFDINGDYNISEGSYNFSIPGILSRDFEIQDGSSVKFSGNIPDSELDIDAVYRLKTSLSSLISDGSSENGSAGSTREVECGISITDRVRNPRLAFSINVPDLNPTVKSQVESALNTDDKVQKQFLALLLMGSFIPDEQSGVVNGSDILLSNVTELMSNQLNSILQKLDIPLDVGIGYQGAAGGTNVFDVAISTQLFNNRVIVGGNVGNRRYGTSAGANGDVVGDLDIQIKLDPEGKFRLNLFSHSADEYSNYLDYSQRNGVGVSYQKEYARFNDLLRSIFGPKKNPADSSSAAGQRPQAVIRIEDEQGETVPDTDSAGR